MGKYSQFITVKTSWFKQYFYGKNYGGIFTFNFYGKNFCVKYIQWNTTYTIHTYEGKETNLVISPLQMIIIHYSSLFFYNKHVFFWNGKSYKKDTKIEVIRIQLKRERNILNILKDILWIFNTIRQMHTSEKNLTEL